MIQELKDQIFAYPFDFLSHAFLLLPVVIAVRRWAYLTPALLVVSLYLGVRFLEEGVFLYYALLVKYNHDIIKGSLVFDSALIGWIYLLSIRNNRFFRQLTKLVTVVAFGIALVNYLSDGSLGTNKAVVRVLMIVLPLIYFNQILAENRVKRIVHHSLFWTSAGFLFYGMGTFMTSVFFDYLIDSAKEAYDQFSNMDQWVSVVLSMLCAAGLWVSRYDRENYLQPI